MQRLLVNTGNVIDVYFYVGETLTDATGSVVVNVYNAKGALITGPVNAVKPAGVGRYTHQLQVFTEVTRIRVTWTGTFGGSVQTVSQYYEIVGEFLFSIADLRKLEGLSDTANFTTDEMIVVREQVTDLFQGYMRTAFGEAYMLETLDGDNLTSLVVRYLPLRRVISLTVGGLAVTGSTPSTHGVVTTKSYMRTGFQNVVIEYSFGHTFVPGDVKRAALRLARHWLLGSDSSIPERARMMTTEWGSFQLTNATADFPTGLPEVDAVLNRPDYNMRLPGFA